jgi:colanic acid biosynthesis glycosyl transferase WcaI
VRILLVNQFFWPDVAATGQFLTDLARHLAREHEVTVICSGGSYAEAGSTEDPPPVKILRVPGLRYRRGAWARAFSYVTFFIGALWYELGVPRPDLVVTMTTPPLLAVSGWVLKSLRGTRHYLWEMDVFPDSLVILGELGEHSWITRILRWIQDSIRSRADGIIALGPCMRERLLERGIAEHLVHVAENWADGSRIFVAPHRHSGPLNILYSGNLGLAHDIDTIADAMRHFRNDPRFLFTFAGGGIKRKELECICETENLRNVQFLPYASLDGMDRHLAQADIGLVTERPDHIGIVVPSKVYGLMAAGRPVLFIGPRRATVDLMIRRFRCGWQIDAGDSESLIELLESLSSNREAVRSYGISGRSAFDQHYDLLHGVSRITAALGLAPAVAEEPGSNPRATANLRMERSTTPVN